MKLTIQIAFGTVLAVIALSFLFSFNSGADAEKNSFAMLQKVGIFLIISLVVYGIYRAVMSRIHKN